jgi:hypothetical protein
LKVPPPLLQFFLAFYAEAFFFAVFIKTVSGTGGLVTVGTVKLGFAGVKRAFRIHNAALLTRLFGLHMLDDHIPLFHDDFTFIGADLQNFTGFANVLSLSGYDHDGVAFSNMHFTHF